MPVHKLLPLLAAALLAAACSGRTDSAGRLSVSARGSPNAAVARGALQVSPTLSVSRVQVLVKAIELEPVEAPPATATGTSMPADHGGGGDDGDEAEAGGISVGPFLIDLSGDRLAGPVTTAFDGRVPPGTYEELRLVVAPIRPADAGPDTALRDLAAAEASVALDGTAGTGATAASFHVTLAVRAQVKKEGTFTVGPATTNVTVPVDAAAWLAGIADPTTPEARALIADRIRASLRIFVDDDEDGEED